MGRKKKTRAANPARTAGKSRLNPRPARRKPSSRKKQAQTPVTPVLDAGRLKDLYSIMTKCRLLAERMYGDPHTNAQPVGFAPGLEAMLVGAGTHLLPQDCVALEHGGFIASLIRGTPLGMILSRPKAGGDSVSTQELTMTTALKLAREMRGQGAVTLMLCPASTEVLAFDAQAMRDAATEKLPMICLMETSFETKIQAQDAAPVAVDSAYYPRITVDGCDVVAVFRVAQEAVRRARQGHGPALIECVLARTNKMAGASGNDASRQDDPLAFMEQYLRRRELWSDEWARSIVTGFTHDVEQALASRHVPSGIDDPFDNVYSSDTARRQSRPQSPLSQPAQ